MNLPKELVLASANQGKIVELQQMLGDLGITITPQKALNIDDVEETGLSFVENAILKARNACEKSGLAAIADDSGLEVDFLKGAPGIYSARFAGPNASDQDNIAKLLGQLQGVPLSERSARYQSVIVLMRHAADPTPIICHGSWEGHISFEQKGKLGFGYDPIFMVNELNCHAAELDKVTKNKISHRGKAIKYLLSQLSSLK